MNRRLLQDVEKVLFETLFRPPGAPLETPTFVGNDLVLLHLAHELDDAVLLLGVELEGLLPEVDGDHLALGHDVDEGAVRLEVAVHAEVLHVLHGGADELHGAALARVARLELRPVPIR